MRLPSTPVSRDDADMISALERASEILADASIEVQTDDRRRLWEILSFVSLNLSATNPHVRDLHTGLSKYLHDTCKHSMRHYVPGPDDTIAEHWQCFWCNVVRWAEEP